MKSKVIIVIDHLGTGGAQQQVLEYLKFANHSRYDIKIINLNAQYNTLKPVIEKLGVAVTDISHRGFFNPKTLSTLVQIFKKEKPDIVHTYLFTADCYARLAARLCSVKAVICAVRNLDTWMKPHHLFVDRFLARFSDRITINAESIRPYLISKEKISSQKIKLIYNGIDLNRFSHLKEKNEIRKELQIPNDALVVGMVGRLSPQKDFSSLLKAAVRILEQFSKAYFVIVGDGPDHKSLSQQAEKLKVSQRVIFSGLRQDAPNIIQIFDIGVLASHAEGCPNVILEYMASTKPVIATDVGGCSELVVHEQTGFIVPENDDIMLAKRICELLSDKNKRNDMGQHGRTRLEKHFTAQTMARNTENLYAELLKPKTAFIFSQFPAYDETFILREMNQLKNTDLNFEIYSLKAPQDKITHEEAQALAKDTVYLPFFSWRFILIKLFYFFKNPYRYIKTMTCVITQNLKSPNFFFKTLAIIPKSLGFAWIARKNKIAIVHGQWATYPTTVAYIISQLNDIPFSFTGHAHDIYLDTTMLAFKIKKARFISTCTANNKEYLLKLLGNENPPQEIREKILVTHHGIDMERFQRPIQGANKHKLFIILSVGSLLECKGFNFLIDACKILKDRGVLFRCIIAGGGKLEKGLKEQISALHLAKRVELTGYIKQAQLIPLYKEADLFVLAMIPEIHWGIPNVLIEAAACRVPVICTMLPSIPELIIDRKTGFIIPPKDPTAIADTVEKVYNDKSLRISVIENAYQMVQEEFNVVKNAQRLKHIIETRQ